MAEEKQLANEEEKTTTEAAQNTDAKEDTKEAAKEKTEETAEKKIFSKKKDKKTEKLEEKLAEYEDLRVRQLAEFENFENVLKKRKHRCLKSEQRQSLKSCFRSLIILKEA